MTNSNISTIYLIIAFTMCLFWANIVVGQNDNKYPIQIADLTLPSKIGEPHILLSATVLDQDYYVLTLRVENNATLRQEITVRPFNQDNFKRELRKGYGELKEAFLKQNIRNGISRPSGIFEKDTSVNILINSSISDPITAYENSLFYQLKGSEIATPVGLGRPTAGSICFSSNITVEKKLDNFNQRKHDDQKEKFIKNEWVEYLKKEHQDTTLKLPRYIRRSLGEKFDLDFNKINDGLFNKKRKEVISQINISKHNGEMHMLIFNSLGEKYGAAYRSVEQDSTIDNNLKIKFLERMANAYLTEDSTIFDKFDKKAIGNDVTLKKIDSLIMYYHKNGQINSLIQLNDFINESIPKWNSGLKYSNKSDTAAKKAYSLFKELSPALSAKTYFDFKVKYAELEFNEGFIENILIVGEIGIINLSNSDDFGIGYGIDDGVAENIDGEIFNTKQIKFENKYPFGFSRKSDYETLSKLKVYSTGKNADDNYTLNVGDFITIYLLKHEVGRRDFSPENRVIRYDPLQGDDCITLYKEETSKLFEARVFSDFVGLDKNATNGLIQTEVAKRMNINTRRAGEKRLWQHFGLISWIEPTVTLSKIEQNNRDLILSQSAPTDQVARKRYYATTLDIRRHESLSVGTRLNAFYFDFPQIKSTFSVNGSIYYGRTPIAIDTTSAGINTLTLAPEIACDVRADERWGLSLSWRWNFMQTNSREIVQISDLLDPGNTIIKRVENNWFNTAQFQVFFKASEDNRGRLFFRYRYHWQYGDQNLGFHQAQVGYSFYLLGHNKGTEKSK